MATTPINLKMTRSSTNKVVRAGILPIRRIDLGLVEPGRFDTSDLDHITFGKPPAGIMSCGTLDFMLDDHDLLRATIGAAGQDKIRIAAGVRRRLNANFRKSSRGCWLGPGLFIDMIGDLDDSAELQLTIIGLPTSPALH